MFKRILLGFLLGLALVGSAQAMFFYGFDNPFDVQTTNGTQTELQRVTVNDDNTAWMEIHVVARRESDGASAVWDKLACVKRVSGGNVAVVGSVLDVVTPQKDVAALLWSVTIVGDGADVVVKVTGASGSTIDWTSVGILQGFIP